MKKIWEFDTSPSPILDPLEEAGRERPRPRLLQDTSSGSAMNALDNNAILHISVYQSLHGKIMCCVYTVHHPLVVCFVLDPVSVHA